MPDASCQDIVRDILKWSPHPAHERIDDPRKIKVATLLLNQGADINESAAVLLVKWGFNKSIKDYWPKQLTPLACALLTRDGSLSNFLLGKDARLFTGAEDLEDQLRFVRFLMDLFKVCQDSRMHTILDQALSKSQIEAFRCLTPSNESAEGTSTVQPEIAPTPRHSRSRLFRAIALAHLKEVISILESGMPANTRNDENDSALFVAIKACTDGYVETRAGQAFLLIVEQLLKHGADPHEPQSSSHEFGKLDTPITLAVVKNGVAFALELFGHAELSVVSRFEKRRLIDWANTRSDEDILRFITSVCTVSEADNPLLDSSY